MRKTFVSHSTRGRVAVAAVGLSAVAALAVPGVAWANDAIPSTEPVVVSVPATQTGHATQSGPAVAECAAAPARVLSQEEVDALIAKGDIVLDTAALDTTTTAVATTEPAMLVEATDGPLATVIRLGKEILEGGVVAGQTVPATVVAEGTAPGADAPTGPDAAITLVLPAC